MLLTTIGRLFYSIKTFLNERNIVYFGRTDFFDEPFALLLKPADSCLRHKERAPGIFYLLSALETEPEVAVRSAILFSGGISPSPILPITT